MLKLINTLFFIFILINAYSQKIIKGNVKDENGKFVSNVNLILYPKVGNVILAYTETNNIGDFTLRYIGNIDSLRLVVTSLGYEKKQILLSSNSISFLTIVVKNAVNLLPEIIIKDERPIFKKADTINYNLKMFADKNDRVIIDVIKNLPGIKVTESGQILYQNKAINKFYVDGKDLLESRYNLATNNLPVNAVDFVQVLENHQPIKMLEGIEDSDRAAINIKLNKDSKLKLLGNGNLGLGIKPFLRNNNIAVLKFAQNVQYINAVKNNNIGINLDKELNDQNLNLNAILGGSIKYDLLNLVQSVTPPINSERYTFNNNTLASSNYLIGLNQTFNLKFNIGYVNDNLTTNSNAVTSIYLPTDTVVINENQTGKSNYHKVQFGAIIDANTKKIYLKNMLKFQQVWSNEYNFISSNNVSQELNNPFVNFINDLNGVININNHLFAISSYTSYTNLPQQLNVAPGQYNAILNAGLPYDGLLQDVNAKTFFSNNTVSYGRKIGSIYFNNKTGILLKLQQIGNNLSLNKDGTMIPANGDFENDIDRNQFKPYNEASFSHTSKKINLALTLNANANILSENGIGLNNNTTNFFFNPNFKLRYNINTFWSNTLNLTIDNDVSYRANPTFILQNYRSLVNSNVPLYKTRNKSINYNLSYKNIVHAIFGNLGVSYGYKRSNVLLQTKFDQSLITQTAILQDNPSNSLNLSGNINKYYLSIKTGIDFNINYAINSSKQIQQSVLTTFTNNTIKFGTKINTQISTAFSLSHVLEFIEYKNSSENEIISANYDPIKFLNQNLSFNLFLPKDYSAKLSFEHYYNNANNLTPVNYFFGDLALQKNIVKRKLDLSVKLSNIFNTKSYTSYGYSNNYLINSNYKLRGRMLLFKVGFQF